VIPREYSATGETTPIAAPMMATTLPSTHWFLFDGCTSETNIASGRGLLEMYICHACGFVEWHCHDPNSIPIGPEYMTDIVDYGPDAPYR
jgi:hypothetical protein